MSEPVRLRRAEHVMGTVFSFDVRAGNEPVGLAALDAAVAWLHRVDEVFSTYRPDSQISRLVRGELGISQCDAEVAEVLRLCEDAEQRSEGWFSASYAGSLDPTGLVKGWAIDQAAQRLRTVGVESGLINGGGDVQAWGQPAPGRPWRIGVSNPLRPGELATVVAGPGPLAVATSGPAERGCHIVDPHTGRPAISSLASMTVIAAGLTEADAWATAAFAMGERSVEWLAELPGVEAFAVTDAGRTWATGGLERYRPAAADY